VFYFPDESQKVTPTLRDDEIDEILAGELRNVAIVPDMVPDDDFDDDIDEGFCILDEEAGTGIIVSASQLLRNCLLCN